jgi:hypothetical protein
MKKPFCPRPSTFLTTALLLSSSAVYAQFENGSMVGTIRDSSGAAVANASVTITETSTGIVSKTKTNSTGDYDLPDVKIGVYMVSVTAPGFSSAVAKEISVSVGGRPRIDLSLKVGESDTSVEVTGVSLAVETDSSERGQTITGSQTASLPLVSRNYSDLLGLVTGVRQAPTAATTTAVTSLVRAGSYNVNGERSMFNDFLLDGVDNNAYGESNQGFDNQIIAIPPDSVSQFEVVTNNESAQYGRASGATINVASKSGTNRVHATLYEFIRNTDLNAAGYIKPTIGTVAFQKPVFNRNQFGGDLGGPLLKDKLFYFLDYEGFRQTLKPLVVLTVPTQNEAAGILAVDVRDPLTGVVYPAGTAIPTTAINPISKQVLGYFGALKNLPVRGSATTGLAANDYPTYAPFTDNSDKGDLRLDYQQDSNTSWLLRLSDRKETGINYPVLPLPLDGQTNGRANILDKQGVVGYTRLLGANKVLDLRLGVSSTKAGKYTLSIGDNVFSIPGLPTNPVVSGGLPSTGVSGGFTAFGRQATNPQWQDPALVDPKASFTWVKGHHSLKFGYEYEKLLETFQDSNPLYGSFTYAAGYSVCPSTTVNGVKTPVDANCTQTTAAADTYWADFLFGTTNNYSLANEDVVHVRQTIQSIYGQDDYKVSPKLTLNLGLRWEYGSPYSEKNNQISNFDPITQTMLTITPGAVQTASVTPVHTGGVYGKSLINPDLADFGPRVGFAYSPMSTVAIRGGYGISYVHYYRSGPGTILAVNAPNAQFVSVTQTAPGTAGYRTVDQGFPAGLSTTFDPATDNVTWVPKNTRDSAVQSFYMSVQQQLAKNTLLDIAYVGNHGTHLLGFVNANQKNPTQGFARPFTAWPSDITEALNEFSSNYNSLQVRYEQRFVAGLTLLNSFTWSHSLDNASAALEGNTPAPQDGTNLRADYSQSDYNLPIANITSAVYDLPVGHGRQFLAGSNALVNGLLGGWQLSGVNTMQAGTVFNLSYTPNSANAVSPQIAANYRGANDYRPNVVAGQPLIKKTRLASGYVQYVNYAALSLPATRNGTTLLSPFGNAARNPGRTPAYYTSDVALNKRFDTPLEGLKVEFRTEAYNVFNHTNLYLPSSGLGGTLGSAPTSGGTITSTFEPRILQFGLKVLY